MALAMPCPCWAPKINVRRTSKSSVPCRCALYSRSARFRMDILTPAGVPGPRFVRAGVEVCGIQVECQPEGGTMIWRRRRRSPEDFTREMDAHIELEAARLVAEGMSPGDARVTARRRFG